MRTDEVFRSTAGFGRRPVSVLLISSLMAVGSLTLDGSFSPAAGATRPLMKPGVATCVYDDAGKLTEIQVQPPEARRWPVRKKSWGLWQAVLRRRTAEGNWKTVSKTGFDAPVTQLRRRFRRLAPRQTFAATIPADGFVRVKVEVKWVKRRVTRTWGKRSALTNLYNGSPTPKVGCPVQKGGSEPPPPQGETPVWWGNAERTALNTNSTLVDTEQGLDPVVGDFDGDGREDIFWYSAAGNETFWWGAGRTFQKTTSAVLAPGGYKVVAGDLDGDGYDDIYFYRAGDANDLQWWGSASRAFEVRNTSDASGAWDQVVAGNFNGDAYDDMFFFRHPDKTKACEFTGPQYYWWGRSARNDLAIGSTSIQMECYYRLFTGDIDGDGRDDMLQYGLPPNPRDFVMFSGSTPQSIRFEQPYGLRPVLGDYDGDGRSDIYWFSTSGADSQWWGPGMRSEFLNSYRTNLNIDGDFYPVSGDFDGDGRDDILWYAR